MALIIHLPSAALGAGSHASVRVTLHTRNANGSAVARARIRHLVLVA